ncbi:hypothetical protein FOA52_005471 [Chlamydomonas sp. UWO 241]|nr:hypothetical protein FOA52_005471 [Chlamydomonas sp. UWO 241]
MNIEFEGAFYASVQRPRSWYHLKAQDSSGVKAVDAQFGRYSQRLKEEVAHPASAFGYRDPAALSPRQVAQAQVQKYCVGSDGQCVVTVLPAASAIASHHVRVLPYMHHDPNRQNLLCFFGYLSNTGELAERVHGVSAHGHEDAGAATTSLVMGLYEQTKEEKLFLSELQGRYAFFLYDGANKCALAARDPSGEQELFYSIDRQTGSVAFTNCLDDLPPGEDIARWQEVPPGHYVSGRTPELRQFALTPQQLEMRERHESADIGYGLGTMLTLDPPAETSDYYDAGASPFQQKLQQQRSGPPRGMQRAGSGAPARASPGPARASSGPAMWMS